ncbi:TetR/AcrR family transcriptional regulator [Acuticoccus sp. MNP-M23]|uniref:TetR/AcrR family transcriptional regulator n=1 Tax=Acuticoccus sp. MNP-M23 TaxID=3072793 RepID=UPI002814A967|nr:TetR/AcrR family transcriptional regulator [Acuticoccus sp. MNP-M23]WMS44518.1 TetR/AcrR family transcriptional regulator [Acuticoccus sp. MNP-M23]
MENKKSIPPRRSPGRPRTIDRDRLMDLAEEIVTKEGAAALTIDALAKAAGVTKGGVQYAFGTKEALVEALFERWSETYSAAINAIVGPEAGAREQLRGHVEATLASDATDHAKSAALMAALLRSPDQLGPARRWYRERIASLDLANPDDRRARLAFLATEGAYMLRFFGLMEIDEAEWQDMFADITALVASASGTTEGL